MQYSCGWAHVGLIGLLFAVNILIMVSLTLKTLYTKVRLFCKKRTYKAKMKEYERKMKLKESIYQTKDLVQDPVDDILRVNS